MAKRQCDECKTTMQSFWPRKRVDGKMLCPACAKTPRGGYVSAEPKTASDDSIHFGPEDMDFFRQMRDAGEMRAQMHDHAQKRVVNLEDPHDLKQHLIEAHGWTDDDFDDGDEGHISHDEMYNGHHQDHDDYAQDFPTASTMSGSHFHQASLGSAGDDDNLYHLSGCHHTSLGRVLGFHTAALSDQEQEERLRAWRAPDPAMEPVRHVIEGARSYASKVGLPDPHDQPYHQIEQTPERIRALGRDYDRLPMNDPAAHPHFEAMRREINHQYDHLTNTMGVKVEPVDHDPYGSVHDMAHDLATNKRLKVLRTAVTGGHPFFSDDENDKFRAVHDAFGHAATGRGFDRHGEEAAWVAHSKMFSPQARPAMTSETRGQNGYLILNGTFGPQKVALLPKDHWMMDQAHHLGSMRVIAHDSGDGETIYHCGRGSERYWTRDGLKTLSETVGTVQWVLTNTGAGGVWREAMIHSFGEQSLLKVTLKRGKQTKVTYWTPEHRWLVRVRQDPARAESRIVTTADLKPGDALSWLLPKSRIGTSSPSQFGIAHGITYGDGTRAALGSTLNLWGEKDEQLLRYFSESPQSIVKTAQGVLGVHVTGLPAFFKDRPSLDESIPYLYGWLAGYFAADGHVSKTGQICLDSSSRENLEFVQVLAARLGIGTYDISEKRRQGYGDEPSTIFKIGFMASTMRPDFFLIKEHRERYQARLDRGITEKVGWVVESVEDEGLVEEVFCPRVPEHENFVLDGWINTMNCPFCGSGQVVARSDGTVECDFCHTAFTVQVQPEMNAFPQTINGQPVDVPGMPGEIDSQDPLDPNGALPGAEDDAPDASGSDNPFGGGDSAPGGDDSAPDDSGEDDDSSGSKPPFQASLSAEDRVYRLAIQNAPADQRMAVIAAVREMRKRK